MPDSKHFYHVSRSGELPARLELDTRHLDIVLGEDAHRASHEILSVLKHYFPTGYSRHGFGYLTEPVKPYSNEMGYGLIRHEYATELVFELVRRLQYPSLPSRFTSLFASETIEDALEFRTSFIQTVCPIYKVESNDYFKADMKLLTFGQSSAHLLSFANRYWKGEGSDNPAWEHLLAHPVTVLERVH